MGKRIRAFCWYQHLSPRGCLPLPGAIYMYKSIKIYTRTRCQVSVYRTTDPLVIVTYNNCRYTENRYCFVTSFLSDFLIFLSTEFCTLDNKLEMSFRQKYTYKSIHSKRAFVFSFSCGSHMSIIGKRLLRSIAQLNRKWVSILFHQHLIDLHYVISSIIKYNELFKHWV